MTQMTEAKKGNITSEMKAVAKAEKIDVDKILKGVANGTIVIPKNIGRETQPCGIGKGLSTKIRVQRKDNELCRCSYWYRPYL